jgi:hypothetical protein
MHVDTRTFTHGYMASAYCKWDPSCVFQGWFCVVAQARSLSFTLAPNAETDYATRPTTRKQILHYGTQQRMTCQVKYLSEFEVIFATSLGYESVAERIQLIYVYTKKSGFENLLRLSLEIKQRKRGKKGLI